jgi:hypothetical protein
MLFSQMMNIKICRIYTYLDCIRDDFCSVLYHIPEVGVFIEELKGGRPNATTNVHYQGILF